MKALPTTYRQITYRSRTEARWAAYFDELRVNAVYEGEGFDLDGMWYLPDFWLPGISAWFEVKGTEPTPDEIEKVRRLAAASGRLVLIAIGHPTTDGAAYNLRAWFTAAEANGDLARFADWGRDNLFIVDSGYRELATLRGNAAEIGGAPEPAHCLEAARSVQRLRFGVHE
jgi:hypothetical protein